MNDFNFDFSQEEEQRATDFVSGPLPAGSCCYLVVEPEESKKYADPREPLVTLAKSGMRRIHFRCTVSRGTYEGVKFWTDVNLPVPMQTIPLTQGQTIACKIGGAQLKALLQSARRPPAIKGIKDFSGLEIVARLKIADKQSEGKNGKKYWNNELDRILIPGDEEYALVQQNNEVITNTPLPTATECAPTERPAFFSSNTSVEQQFAAAPQNEQAAAQPSEDVPVDKVPF